MATVVDVARRASVSPGIVSRLLNGDPTLRVRDETRQRILQAASDLDYLPNAAARTLRMSRSGTIGLAVHDASNPVYSEIIAGAQTAATAAGSVLMLTDVNTLAQGGLIFQRMMSGGSIDGLLLQRAGTESDAFVSRLAAKEMPLVLLNDRTDENVNSVGVDDYAAVTLGTEHLLSLGHREIGYLGVDGDLPRTALRQRAWQDALTGDGLEVDLSWVVTGGHTAQTGYEAMSRILDGRRRPTAVFVANVLAGVGALTACRDKGVAVPEDISVIGLHDIPLADHLSPRLTVVRLPLFDMGARAVGVLLEHLDDGIPRHEIVSDPAPVLVIRDTTAQPRS